MLGLETKTLFGFMFGTMLLSNIIVGVLKYLIFRDSFSNQNKSIELIDNTSFIYLVLATLIAPLLETTLSQKMVIGVSRLYVRNNLICVLISSILFGLMHYNNEESIIDSGIKVLQTTIMGICLGLFYTILKRKRLHAFYLTALLHASWNLFTFILRLIIKQ